MKVDCYSCNNYPMSVTLLPETGGMGVYFQCRLCGNAVRIPTKASEVVIE